MIEKVWLAVVYFPGDPSRKYGVFSSKEKAVEKLLEEYPLEDGNFIKDIDEDLAELCSSEDQSMFGQAYSLTVDEAVDIDC